MSEIVERHMESMTPEIVELTRIKLFSPEEIRQLILRRREFELKINSITKKLDDFKAYITFEKLLLKQVQLRRHKNLVDERKTAIEYKIMNKIKSLYDIAVQRFSSDLDMKLDYFKFCKQSNFVKAASTICQSMLKSFGHKPQVWLVATRWYAEDLKDTNQAFKFLHNGLARLKDSQELYTAGINLELSVVKDENNATCDRAKEQHKRVCERIEKYVNLIFENIKDAEYLVEVLSLLEKYTFTISLQNSIIKKLLNDHREMECVWDALAQRELRGLHYSTSNDKPTQSQVSLCAAKYKEGLHNVSPTQKATLLSKYLDCLTSIVPSKEDDKQLSASIKNDLKAVLEEEDNEQYLTKEWYIFWLELATESEARKILEKATSSNPGCIELWELRLKHATIAGKNSEVDRIFQEGTKSVKDQGLSLWLIYLRYYSLLSNSDVIEKIYREGVKQPQPISEMLKPKYIEWLALEKGMSAARKQYSLLSNQPPFCKELHTTMSNLESTERKYDLEFWNRVHELACQQFGKNDVDVWINYIMFFMHFNRNTSENDGTWHTRVQAVHDEALATLDPLLLPEFNEKYMITLGE